MANQRNYKKPGNHQSPTNTTQDGRNIILEGSQGNDMEFEVDSNFDDNGNVDQDADDQGAK